MGEVGVQPAHVGEAFVRPRHGQQLVPSMAIGSMAMMLSIGGRFVGGGTGDKTVMLTGAEVPVAPLLSVATVLSAKLPAGALLQIRPHSSLERAVPAISRWPSPRLVLFSKNSTELT